MGHLPARATARTIDPYATQQLPALATARPCQRHVDADAAATCMSCGAVYGSGHYPWCEFESYALVPVLPERTYVLELDSPLAPRRGPRHHLTGELVVDPAEVAAIRARAENRRERKRLTAELRQLERRHRAGKAARVVAALGIAVIAPLVIAAVLIYSATGGAW